MSIQAINLGSSPTGAGGDTLREGFNKANQNFTELFANRVGIVAGGTGYTDASGAVELDFNDGDTFLLNVTGNITALTVANLPDLSERQPTIRIVLKIDATAGHVISGQFTVDRWIDGSDWTDLSLAANDVNIIDASFFPSLTIAGFVKNADLVLEPYGLSFAANGTQAIPTGDEDVDLANAEIVFGTGTVTYKRSIDGGAVGSDLTTRTSFGEGDSLHVTLTGGSALVAVRIPRFDR